MGEGGTAPGKDARVKEISDRYRQELWSLVDPDDQAGRLVVLRQGIDCLELDFCGEVASFAEAEGFTEDDPTNNPVDWMRHECKMQRSAAADRVRVGQQLERLSATVEAVRRGEIGFAHMSVIANTLSQALDANADVTFPEAELLERAKTSSPGRLWHLSRRMLHALNADAVARKQRIYAEMRWLRFSDTENGTTIVSGELDSVGAAAVRTAIEPLARRTGEGDDRCLERRQADAIVELALLQLDGGRLPHVATQRPHLQVHTTLETLCGKPGAPAAEMEFAEPIATPTVQRLACDAAISRVVFGPGSVILDAGRARRVVSSATRRALDARDQHCQWPGCERPARMSAAHHLVHWVKGGPTDLSNMILLCHRHHWAVHEGGWKLARADDERLLAIPPTWDYFHRARAPDETDAA